MSTHLETCTLKGLLAQIAHHVGTSQFKRHHGEEVVALSLCGLEKKRAPPTVSSADGRA